MKNDRRWLLRKGERLIRTSSACLSIRGMSDADRCVLAEMTPRNVIIGQEDQENGTAVM
jgi:hypothetical protein